MKLSSATDNQHRELQPAQNASAPLPTVAGLSPITKAIRHQRSSPHPESDACMRMITTPTGTTFWELPSEQTLHSDMYKSAYFQDVPQHLIKNQLDHMSSTIIDENSGWPKPLFRTSSLDHMFHANKGKSHDAHGAYAVIDINNLNGLHATLVRTEGMIIFKKMAQLIQEELQKEPDIQLFHHGGDELSVCLPGRKAYHRLEQAMLRANDKVETFLAKPYETRTGTSLDLRRIPHPKHPNASASGTGITFYVTALKPNESTQNLLH